MTDQEKFICIISNDRLKKSDAIIILEGDGFNRIAQGAKLFKEGWAPFVIISGGVVNPPHSIPAQDMLSHLIEAGVPENNIILEEKSLNTRDQGVEIMKLANEKKWKRIIIVASHYHQYRAYLTFLKAMRDSGSTLEIINAPARDLLWFSNDEQGMRFDLLKGEFERIHAYAQKGHIASFEDALEYQKWKESQK